MEDNSNIRIYCNSCRQYTNHELAFSNNVRYMHESEILGQPEDYYTSHENLGLVFVNLWICRGCERATMQEIIEDDDGKEISSELYPSREKYHLMRKSFVQLGPELSKIYEEIIVCYNNEAPILCATGLRALLEGVCDDKGITGRNLYSKINNLDTILPKNIVESLHYFRSIGNDAVHELSAPSMDELRSTIEVMEGLLNFLYDLDYKAAYLSRKAGIESGSQQHIRPLTEVIKRVLERSPLLSPGLQNLFRILYQAGDKGLKYSDIALQLGMKISQLNGVLGALERRINNTDGVVGKPGIGYLFELMYEDDIDPNTWGWVMKSEMRDLIKSSGYSWAKEWK